MLTTRKDINRPSLKVSDAKKRSKDFAHTKKVIDYFAGSAFFADEGAVNINTDRDIRMLYDVYNTRLPDKYFNHVLNPLNTSENQFTSWPARIRCQSIIRPNIDLIEGEYEKRGFNYTIKINNPDAVNIAQDLQYKQLLSTLEQMFINQLNEKGYDTQLPNQEVESVQKLKRKFASNYRDERVIWGEAILNVVIDEASVEEKLRQQFHDWAVAGEALSYKGIRGGKFVYERVSPLDIDYDKSPDKLYIEDGQYVVRRIWMTSADIIDNWYDELKAQDIKILEDENTGSYSFRTVSATNSMTHPEDEDLRRSKVLVYHVCWKYLTKIGILTYSNPTTGEIEQTEVPDTYVPDESESVEWFWVNEVWEGYRINDELYVGIGPVEAQRNVINNMSSCKLPYNGRMFSDVHSQNMSLVELGLPYEILHRILHFQLEKTIAKSKGKILLIDNNVIPRTQGWTEDKFFYWTEATGWGPINRNQVGVDRSYNQYQVVDMGLYQHIMNLIDVMNYVKQEWDELLGITRQRKGQIKSSDTVGGSEISLGQSTVISERIFSKFEEYVQRELNGILDCSKMTYKDGLKRLYTGEDMTTIFLDIEPARFAEAELGVFVSKSGKDLQELAIAKQHAQAFIQNGAAPSTAIEVIRAKSLSKLSAILKAKEAESIEAQQEAGLREAEQMERLELIKGQFVELQGIIDERLMEAEYDRKEEIEHIKGAYSTYRNVEGTGDNNADGVPDMLEVRAQFADESDKRVKQSIEAAKLRINERQKDRELNLKEKELVVRERIADKANKTALKNKTSGESKSKKK